MRFKGTAKRLDDVDLPRIGSRIGVGEDELHAVLDVEAAGSGFDSQGRVKMLFEPHKFWDELGPGAKRDQAARQGLAYSTWGSQPYPSDSYPRLTEAMQIDKIKALRSCSWGLGQIMGFNHKAAGYPTVESMIEDFCDDEETHLEAMVQFIISNKLDDELRAHDWAGFAHGYNGTSYAKHGYHLRLADAYNKWANIRDTPWDRKAPPPRPVPVPRPPPSGATDVTGTVVTGGGASGAVVAAAAWPEYIIPILVVIVVGVVGYFAVRYVLRRKRYKQELDQWRSLGTTSASSSSPTPPPLAPPSAPSSEDPQVQSLERLLAQSSARSLTLTQAPRA